MKINERGFTLIEALVWVVIMAMLSTLVGNIFKLQLKAKAESDVSQFYDELNLVDSYIMEMYDENGEISISYTETELELTSEKHAFMLNKTMDGVAITYKELSTNTVQNMKLRFVKSIKIAKLETLVMTGSKGNADYIYRVPVKSSFQIFFNDEYLEENWFKEVITYAF